ncbi:MAG: hypothetical protein ACM3PD_06300, partial [Chloroflexota bacterium]
MVAFHICELSLAQMEAARFEWTRLAAQVLEPNAFSAPGFLLAAARHFPQADRPRFIVLHGDDGRFFGLFPLAAAGLSGSDGFIRL